jgi:hypothetical protein
MKKRFFLFAALMAVIFVGCKKDENTGTKNSDSLTNTPYTTKTIAETKADIDQTGVDVVDQMKNLNDEKGMTASVNLLSLAVNNSNSKVVAYSPAANVLKALKTYRETRNVSGIMSTMRKAGSDPVSIVDQFNKITGVYEYNFDTKSFDSIASSTNVVFNFPTTKDGTTNDGKLTVYVPQVKTGPFTYGSQEVSELPTLISFDIKVDGTTGLTYQFTGTYNDQGVPSNITSTLTIGTFEFKSVFNYSTAASDVDFSIKHAATTIIDVGGGVGGNFDKTNIENAYHYEYDTAYSYYDSYLQKEVYIIDTNKVVDPEKILYNANAHFQLMNIKIAGQVDFKDLYTKMNTISDQNQSGVLSDDAADAQRITLINKDLALIVVYADKNTMIAQAEAYLNTTTDDYGNTNKNLDFRMIFADKSKTSLDVYFKDGFTKMFDEMDTFISEMNAKYGWSINPVERPTK